MTTFSKSVLAVALVGAILGTLAFFNLTPFRTIVQEVFGSTAGSLDSKQAQLYITGWNLAIGTTTSVQNTTGSDVYATQLQYVCTGVGTSLLAYTGTGIASVTLKGATTSASLAGQTPISNTGVANTNLVFSTTLATSSTVTLVASTTPVIAGNIALNDDIPNNAWITFFVSATNTAICNIGVQTIGS